MASSGKMSRSSLGLLKSWQFKYWAFLTGLASTGTKNELHKLVTGNVSKNLGVTKGRHRIVSVDMGIRNLAFCAIDLPAPPAVSGKQGKISIPVWRRMDLIKVMQTAARSGIKVLDQSELPLSDELTDDGLKAEVSDVVKSDFTPPILSKTAYHVTQELLALEPDTILIERQRFRSGGAAAIQEWTVRVNMLESMLWACLETLRSQKQSSQKQFPTTYAIDPARVARFWVPGEDLALRPPKDIFTRSEAIGDGKPGRRKVEKKEKVAVVKSWIKGDPETQITFAQQAAEMAGAFDLERTSRSANKIAGGKLDDLADCLLQGMAFIRWEENRKAIDAMYQSFEKSVNA